MKSPLLLLLSLFVCSLLLCPLSSLSAAAPDAADRKPPARSQAGASGAKADEAKPDKAQSDKAQSDKAQSDKTQPDAAQPEAASPDDPALGLPVSILTPAAEAPAKTPEEKLAMLAALVRQERDQAQELATLNKTAKGKPTEAQKAELEALRKRQGETARDFERIATGVELSAFAPEGEKKPFDWKAELGALVEPLLKELREFTAAARQKAELRETLATLDKQTQTARQAAANLDALMKIAEDEGVKRQLAALLDNWRDEEKRLSGKLELAQMDLHALTNPKETAQGKAAAAKRGFFQTRGLYLLMGLGAFVLVFLFLRLFFRLLTRRLPKELGGRKGLYGRLLGVFSHFLSLLFATLAMLAVFFVVGDGFMISLAALLLLGALWTLRQTLPHQWQRSLFLLNMGSVREGERLLMNGVPWRVDSLGVFCALSNPVLGQTLRLPLDRLLSLDSRPCAADEPWFPCGQGDYLRFKDGMVAWVTHLSSEQVCLTIASSDTTLTYSVADFLKLAAANLSRGFTVSVTLPLAHALLPEITGRVPDALRDSLQARLDKEDFGERCHIITCELGKLAESSLDMAVTLECPGDMASMYSRLHRMLAGWCADCCAEQGWEIPCQQVAVRQVGG